MLYRRAFYSLNSILFLSASVLAQDAEKITYEDHVRPLLENKCFSCHNPDKKKGDLDLTSMGGVLTGGGGGAVVDAGNPDSSRLWTTCAKKEEPFMPPEGAALDAKDLAILAKWISGGVLETKSSIAKKSSKPKVDMAVVVTSGKPSGPIAKPENVLLEPVVVTPRSTAVTAMAASPWTSLVAFAAPKQVLLYDTETRQLAGIFPYTEGYARSLSFSRNGSLLVMGGGRGGKMGHAVVWDVKTGKRVVEVGKEFDQVMSADISPDQKMVVIGSPSKKVKVYDTGTGEELYTISKHTEWIMGTAFSPDGVLLASSDRNGNVMVWEASNGGEFYVLGQHKASSTDLAWRADSNILASSSRDGSIILWEMTEGKQVATWQAHGSGTESLSFTPEGTLVTCGLDGSVSHWDIKGSKLADLPKQPDVATQVVALHDGKTCVVGNFLGEVKVYDLKMKKEVGALSSNPPLIAQRIIEAEKRATELVVKLPALQDAAKKAEAGLKASEDSLVRVRAELAEQERRSKSYPAEIAGEEKELAAAKAAITKATADKTARLAAIKAFEEKSLKFAALQKELATAVAEAAKVAVADKAASDANAALEAAKKELAAKAGDAALTAKVKDLEGKLTAAKAEQQKLAPLKAKADQLTASAAKAKAELGAAPAPVADLDKLIADNTPKVKTTADSIAAKKAELPKLPALVKAGPDRIKSAESQVVKGREDLASAQFTAKSVTEEINILQKLPTALKAAQFNVGVLSEKANLAKLEGSFNDYTAAKKDNEDAKVSNTAKIESSKKTIAETTAAIPQHEATTAKLKTELNALEQASAPSKGADATANANLENHQKTLAARVAEVAALTKAKDEGVAAAKKAADDIGKAIEPLKKKLAEVSAKLKGPADQVASKQANVAKLDAAHAEAKKAVSALTPLIAVKEKTATEAEAAMKKSAAEIQAAEKALSEVKKGKDAPAIAKAQSELDAKRAAKSAGEKSLNDAKQATNKAKAELAAANNTQTQAEKRLSQAKAELAAADKNAAPFKGQFESITKEIAAQEKARADKQALPAGFEADFASKTKPINDAIAQLKAAQAPLEKSFADARAKLEGELKIIEAKRIEVTKATEIVETTKKQKAAAESALAAAEKDNPQRDKNLAEISAELAKLQPQLEPMRAKVKQLETQYFTMLPK